MQRSIESIITPVDDDMSPHIGSRIPPERVAMIVDMLARSVPYTAIAEGLHMDTRTVLGVARRHCPSLVDARARLQREFYVATTAAVQSATQRAIDGKAGAMDAKLLADAYLTLNGEATQIVEHQFSTPEIDALEAKLINPPTQSQRIIDVEMVEDALEPVSAQEKPENPGAAGNVG